MKKTSLGSKWGNRKQDKTEERERDNERLQTYIERDREWDLKYL